MLKAGTPCWLTKCAPHLLGVVVEVESFYGQLRDKDAYWVKTKEPILGRKYTFKTDKFESGYDNPTKRFLAWRIQLVPIVDPNKKLDTDEWAPVQDDWKVFNFPRL
jgi:hypothetical protein